MTDLSRMLERKIEEARLHGGNAPDGFRRSRQEEERINQLCRAVLTTSQGEALMNYLRSITTNAVMPVGATDAELRDREGMRRLVGILDRRRLSKPNGHSTEE